MSDLRPRSLRVRLVLLAAASIAVAMVLAGAFIFSSFSASIETERRDDLQAGLDRLISALDPDSTGVTSAAPLTDPRYDTPLSGMYWQVDDLDTGQVVRSRSLWDQQLQLATPGQADAAGLTDTIGPQGEHLIVLSRVLSLEGTKGPRHFNAAIAEARSRDDDPIQRFGTDLLLALVALGTALATAAAVQVHYGMQPLGTLRRQITEIRQGSSNRLTPAGLRELDPVVEQINELLEAQEATITFARERAADLAHGLKTPLAVLSATAERLRQADNRADADLLEMLIDQMNARIDYQLKIARLRFRTRAQGAAASLNETVLRSVAVLRKSPLGEHLNWVVDLNEQLEVDMDAHDLLELIGIVLENASQWARRRVQVTCLRQDAQAELIVEDDGVGMSTEGIGKLGVRGMRLDQDSPGEGIGLAIAYQIVRLNRGRIDITSVDGGGLRVRICLPLHG